MAKIKCTFCGYVFEAEATGGSCGGCLRLKQCEKVCCPNCGYPNLDVPGRERLRRRRGQADSAAPSTGRPSVRRLAGLEEGTRARVVSLDTADAFRLQKLLSLGLLPGVLVEVVQRYPCYVINVGLAQVAMDLPTAEAVYVREEPGWSEA